MAVQQRGSESIVSEAGRRARKRFPARLDPVLVAASAISIGLLAVKDEKQREAEESERGGAEPQVTLDPGKPRGNGRAEGESPPMDVAGNSTLPWI